MKAQQIIEHKIEKKETPFGYAFLHAGKKIICDENLVQ
jgi:hypothetical protein